jgi:hypothetical protein
MRAGEGWSAPGVTVLNRSPRSRRGGVPRLVLAFVFVESSAMRYIAPLRFGISTNVNPYRVSSMAKQSSPSRRPATPSARATSPSSTARRTPSTRRRPSPSQVSAVSFGFPWRRQNVIGICVGIAVIVIGYILMGSGITADVANNDGIWNNANSTTVGPILLVIGYCAIIPYFIFKRFGTDEVVETETV